MIFDLYNLQKMTYFHANFLELESKYFGYSHCKKILSSLKAVC